MLKVSRMCVYPKDVQRITGRTERYGRKLLKRIKDHLKKESYQLVSIEEFCHFTGLKSEDVKTYLTD
jgi:hypothetical protein